MSLGRTLKQIRLEQGLTLAQLAEKVGSHVGNLSRIERDVTKPSLELLFRLAKTLDYHLADIFSLSDEDHCHDAEQLALNTVFISLLAEDRELLLEFAKLLKSRAKRSPFEMSELARNESWKSLSPGGDRKEKTQIQESTRSPGNRHLDP